MRSKLTRTAHGLDSPRDDQPALPCVENPDAWALESAGSTNRAVKLSPDNAEALAACLSCPIRTRCRDEWAALPAERRAGFVAGGVVWDRKGRPASDYRVVQWW